MKQNVNSGNFDDVELYFLPEEYIKMKLNWIPQHFALNIFPDTTAQYFKSSLWSKYPAFRQTYPPNYYVWFYKNKICKNYLIKEVNMLLVK